MIGNWHLLQPICDIIPSMHLLLYIAYLLPITNIYWCLVGTVATIMWALWHLIILKSMAIIYLSQLLLNNSNHCKNTAKVAGTFAASKSCCNITVLSFCISTVQGRLLEFNIHSAIYQLYQNTLTLLLLPKANDQMEPILIFSPYSWRRDHSVLYFLKKCIILAWVSCEPHFARISSSLEKPAACRWRASIFSNSQEASLRNSANWALCKAYKRMVNFFKK